MPPLPGHETILVVDDEQAVCAITRKMLERYGYRVICVTCGEAALEVLRSPDGAEIRIMLIDIVMPEMNGVELVKRANELQPDIPYLYFSAYSDIDQLRPALSRGLPYISKPFTSIKLTKRIRQVLDSAPKP